jgi:hypothetical protein
MPSHHIHPGGTHAPQFLVTTTHADGVVCHHTGATHDEVAAFASGHAEVGDEVQYFTIAPGRIDGVHWVLVA